MTAAAVDTLGQPDGFVTWRVFSAADSVRPVKGAVSGDDGLISTPLPHRGDYRLVVVGMNSAVAERQFSVSDERSPREVERDIHAIGYETVWKDWDRIFD